MSENTITINLLTEPRKNTHNLLLHIIPLLRVPLCRGNEARHVLFIKITLPGNNKGEFSSNIPKIQTNISLIKSTKGSARCTNSELNEMHKSSLLSRWTSMLIIYDTHRQPVCIAERKQTEGRNVSALIAGGHL